MSRAAGQHPAEPVPVELREYERRPLEPGRLSRADAELLWRHHARRISVEFPSPQTDERWRLTSRGWVGFLPVSPTCALRLQPKVPLRNLFHMLEVAYDLSSFEIFDGLADCRALEDFYERLAHVLARRVLDRSRQGLHREYVDTRERLAAVRGRIDLDRQLRDPWRPGLHCEFKEHTADIGDNRILLWTLDRIRRNAACRRPAVRRTVRTAFRRLQGSARLHPISADDCLGRSYSRLNEDYRPLHALCRFFLEHTGPSHEAGDHRNLPFLVDMAALFERFVAEWLRTQLPAPYRVARQERVVLDRRHGTSFDLDLVLYGGDGNRPRAVLDTKYKDAQRPATGDIAQVVAYAAAKRCDQAVLIYPIPLPRPLDIQVGSIRVRSLGFPLGGDLDAAGRFLLGKLGLEVAHGGG